MTRSPNMVGVRPITGDMLHRINGGHAWAMPSARAATPSGLNRLRRFRASIASAIASAPFAIALCLLIALYFGGQIVLRGWA